MKGVIHNGMSLFQDLKLKRRKVDSRCSSDGESIGTSESASSLSPDGVQSEGSPKQDKDRCLTPEELVPPPVSSKGSFQPQIYFMIKASESRSKVPYNNNNNNNNINNNNHIHSKQNGLNGVIKMTNGSSNGHHNDDEIIVKSEPIDLGHHDSNGDKDKGHSCSPGSSPGRGGSSPDKSPMRLDNGSNTNSPKTIEHSSDTESIVSQCSSALSRASSVSIKREKVVVSLVTDGSDKEMMENGGGKEVMTSLREMERERGIVENGRKSSPPHSRSASSSPPGPRVESTLTITKHREMNGRIPSPPQSNGTHHNGHMTNGHMTNGHMTNGHGNGHHHADHNLYLNGIHPPQNHLHARLTGTDLTPRSLNVPSPLVHSEIRNLTEKPDPLSVVTSTSLSFHHHSMYRINGVRPEVISGGAVTPTTANNNSNSNSTTSSTSSNHSNNSNSPTGATVQSRKSPTLSHQSSRSPNSSPNNSNSSGSLINGSLHSPGTTIVAGGSLGMVNSSTGPSNHHHHVNLNRTPTVIMGEAGGVRTMLWSQPGQTIPTPPHTVGGMSPPTTNGHSNGYGGISNGHGSPVSMSNNNNHNNNNNNSPPANNHPKGGLSMEKLWATEALNLSTTTNCNTNSSGNVNGHVNHNNNHPTAVNNLSNHLGLTSLNNINSGHVTNSHNGHSQTNPDDDDYEQPMICMICEDRATGLHYGIITCEGCKGFFKRTVQNRRVYTCVADGTCEITKAQRNRCQYCRFKKCIEQGMVLQAVREDRMPGGRNSGAVYNLYKVPVKYRKHKKGNRVAAGKAEKNSQQPPPSNPPVQSGNILKAALTSPNDVTHRPSMSMPFETAHAMITELVQCDNFHDISALQNWEELLEARGDLSDKLCQMGDSIVYRLVQWTKRLPFYPEVPVDVHTRVLTHKWHELLVLTTSAWQAMHTPGPPINVSAEEETMESLQVLQRCLQAMMGRSLTLEQLRQDVGQMVERLTYLTRAFRRMNVRLEEYVCLKVITMLQNTGTRSPEVGVIQERYVKCLRTFLEINCPGHPNRLSDLLRTLPEVQTAAALLLESKMFYVPFLLNSALLQR